MANAEAVEKEDQAPKLRLLTGGKGPVDPKNVNWLSTYISGTIFLCRKRSYPGEDLDVWEILYTWGSVALLFRNDGTENGFRKYVATDRFSQLYEPVEIIFISNEEFWNKQKQLREQNNDEEQRDRADQPD